MYPLTSSIPPQNFRTSRYTIHAMVDKPFHPLFKRRPTHTVHDATALTAAPPPGYVRYIGYYSIPLPQCLADEAARRIEILEFEMKDLFHLLSDISLRTLEGNSDAEVALVPADGSPVAVDGVAVPASSHSLVAATSDSQKYNRLDALNSWGRHVAFSEEVIRRFFYQEESEAFETVTDYIQNVLRVLQTGLAPMKRVLHRFVLRQRSVNSIRDKKCTDCVILEADRRKDIRRDQMLAYDAHTERFVESTENLHRRQLTHVAFSFFYGAARVQIGIQMQIDSFQMFFACPQISAPKVCGRVAQHSLFHHLSLTETHWRGQLYFSHQHSMSGLTAIKEAVMVEEIIEPNFRADVESTWHDGYDKIRRLKKQVMGYYARREMEHVQHQKRLDLEAVESSEYQKICSLRRP